MVNGSYLLKGPIWQWPTPVLMKSVYNEKPDLAGCNFNFIKPLRQSRGLPIRFSDNVSSHLVSSTTVLHVLGIL